MTKYFYTAGGNLEIIDTPEIAHACLGRQASARVYPWHIHLHHWTAGRVVSGAVCLRRDDAMRRYRANEIFLIPPRAPHQLVVEPGAALTVLSYLSPAGLVGLMSPLFASRKDNIPFSVDEGLRQLFLAACDTPTLYQKKAAHRADTTADMAKAIARIVERIVAKPQAEFPLAAMAEEAGFSRWHFLRRFRADIGMTPHALQTQCRLRLLRAGIRMDADLASLAVSTGFSDQSHMHKLFKRHHCLTPKQFRRASFSLPL